MEPAARTGRHGDMLLRMWPRPSNRRPPGARFPLASMGNCVLKIPRALLSLAADRIDQQTKPNPIPANWEVWRIRRAIRWLINAYRPGINRTGSLWIQRALNLRGQPDPNQITPPPTRLLDPHALRPDDPEVVARQLVKARSYDELLAILNSPEHRIDAHRKGAPALLRHMRDAAATELQTRKPPKQRGKRRKGAQSKH